MAWDTGRGDWRTYRVDRIEPRDPTGPRFAPRPLPAEDLAAYVVARRRHRRPGATGPRVTVFASAAEVAARLPIQMIPVEAIDDGSCSVQLGSDSLESLAVWLGVLGADFRIEDAPELAAHLRVIAERYRRAAGDQ